MALTVKKNTAVGIEIESTEGTYVAPTSASKYVQILSDGFEVKPQKEVINRNVFTASIGQTTPRTGQFQVSGTIPVEARASSSAGGAPEFDALMRSAMGARRQSTTTVTTKASGNTGSVLQIQDADINDFAVGDMVLVKDSGAYHVSPVSVVTTTGGSAAITLLVAKPTGSFSNSVVIEKFTTYYGADSGHPSLSISKYIEGAILEKSVGCKVTTMALEGFTTGKLPSFKFGFEGLDYSQSVTSNPYTPSYDTALPPIILSAKVYMDGAEIEVNDVSFAVQNSLGFKTYTGASNGRASSRATNREITGSFNPYKQNDSVANYTKYKNNTEFSLFGYAMIPTNAAGTEFNQVVAFYMPKCTITELGEADQDGLLQEAISFRASRGTAGTTNELYISFI